jgi:hypothetical protein
MSRIGPEGGLVSRFSTDVNSDRLAAAWWAAERARRRPFALPVRNDPSPTDRLAGRDLDGNTHAPSISSAAGCRAAVRGGSISSWRCAFKGPTSQSVEGRLWGDTVEEVWFEVIAAGGSRVAALPVSAASPQVAAIGDGIGISLRELAEVLGGSSEVEFVTGAIRPA